MKNEMLDLLFTRRSVRAYLPQQVEEEKLDASCGPAPTLPPAWGSSPR